MKKERIKCCRNYKVRVKDKKGKKQKIYIKNNKNAAGDKKCYVRSKTRKKWKIHIWKE